MDKNDEKDAVDDNDGQTVSGTDNEDRDGQIVHDIDTESVGTKSVDCIQDESQDDQTVIRSEVDDTIEATGENSFDDKNDLTFQKESSPSNGGNEHQTHVNDSDRGKRVIEKAEIARKENKKKEALDLYKNGIQLLIQGLKVEQFTEEEKAKLKQSCADYLSIAENLKKEIDTEDKHGNEDDRSSVDPEDKHIVNYVNELIKTERPNIRLDDVFGCEKAKECLKESVILPAMFPKLFSGGRSPWRGILLFGAPGTGKTMIGRALAGQCPELGFIRVNACDLISKYVGDPEKIIKYLFKKVQELRPCILFFDDIGCILYEEEEEVYRSMRRARTELLVQIQGIGQDRDGVHIITSTSEPWRINRSILKRIIRELYEKAGKLKEKNVLFIDDFELLSDSTSENAKKAKIELIVQFYEHKKVCLLVASNQPWVIDPFHRKRLEKRILIPMPDKVARKQIILKNLESINHEMTDEDLDELAEKLDGYTGSDIVVMVRDAAMEPIREIQKATHFRKVYKDSKDTSEDNKDFQYQVCTADDPDSIAMTLDDILVLEPNQLLERPLHKDDLMKCLSRSRPSVDEEYLKQLNQFVEDFV